MLTPEQYAAALDALRSAGLIVDEIEFDWALHRVPTQDKPNSKNGAYLAYGDAPASVWWQNWATDETGTWTAKGQGKLSPEARQALALRMEEARKARDEEQALIHTEAAAKSKAIYSAAADCTEHAYLTAKGVKAVSGLKVSTDPKYDSLIVPLYNSEGTLAGLQFIGLDGSKRYLFGTNKKGSFFPIRGKDVEKPLVICEGLATGLSLHECLGFPALVAFDAGNLLLVAEMARAKYPERKIILAADNDTETKGNPGVKCATAAALAVGGFLAIPRYEGLPVDWNDLHQKMNPGEVRTQFMNYEKPVRNKQEARCGEELPAGFSLRSGGSLPGLWFTEEKEDADPVETWIGPALHVLGATRDENSKAWGLLLEWEDPDGRQHSWAMDNSLLVGKDVSVWLGRLADEGWIGATNNKTRGLLTRFLTTFCPKTRIRCVPCTGWHRGAFVFPDTVMQNSTSILLAGRAGHAGQANGENDLMTSSNEAGLLDGLDEPGEEKIVLQVQTAHNPFRMGGTLEGWKDTVGRWTFGNSRLMLALCASFAAPLLEIAGHESGGFNFTGQSSTGKTTALVAAGSVWGKGSSSGGYVQNWRATSNGLEGLAALHSDAALCLDEIGQAPGRTIMEASYMLANGMGKARACQDGSAKGVKSWRLMVLSTGEKGLAEKIAEEGGRVQAGQAVRLIDIPSDAGEGMGIFENIHAYDSPRAFADAIKQAATTHYGHAARAFITMLLEHRQEVEEGLAKSLDNAGEMFCPEGSAGQVERVARRFALCAAAGEMAAEWGLMPWGEGEGLAAVKKCFDAWLSFRGGPGAAEDTAILEQVNLFLEQHGSSRFQDINTPAATCISRAGFRRETEAGIEFYILPESFKADLCKGYNHNHVAAVLRDKGLLLPGDSRGLKRRPPVDLPGFGRKRCYTLFIGGGADGMA